MRYYMTMAYNIKTFDERVTEVIGWLTREFSGIRTGRATPMLLDLVTVESYGTRVPLNQVGNVNVEDPRTLRISVWDQSAIKAVEKGIQEADLGISVIVDGSGLRIVFPELTGERRTQLLKLAKGKLEEARVSLRSARDASMKEIDALHKQGETGDDERFSLRTELQKRVDKGNEELERIFNAKEKEINE